MAIEEGGDLCGAGLISAVYSMGELTYETVITRKIRCYVHVIIIQKLPAD
jgi:hypothetical protein